METLPHNGNQILINEPIHATNKRQSFCFDPVLFPALESTQTVAPSSAIAMNACYPKCMDIGNDKLVQNEDKRSSIAGIDLTQYKSEVMQTFDLEELGLVTDSLVSEQQERSIIVDYEDSAEDHVECRDKKTTCVLSACGPLTDSPAAVGLSNGRLPCRRSRCSSLDTVSLRGKSVSFQQDIKRLFPRTADTSVEDEMRCSKVYKLCMCEVKLHCSLESCWLVSSNHVYDVTGLVTAHPGGVHSILRKAGGPDCVQDMKFHTKKARKIMEKCFIGKLVQCGDDVNCTSEINCSIM